MVINNGTGIRKKKRERERKRREGKSFSKRETSFKVRRFRGYIITGGGEGKGG